MTKKHFIRAAEIVKAILNGHWSHQPPTWAIQYRGDYDVTSPTQRLFVGRDYLRAVQTAEAFIVLARQFNPRFDTHRFLVACGLVEQPTTARKGVPRLPERHSA